MAIFNDVGNRVHVGGEFRGDDFARFTGHNPLLLVDIEGAELELLDPARWPALLEMDIIVEIHECFRPGLAGLIAHRFAATHDIEIIYNRSIHFPLEPIFGKGVYLDHFDNMVITFEGRNGPTPWAVMRRKF